MVGLEILNKSFPNFEVDNVEVVKFHFNRKYQFINVDLYMDAIGIVCDTTLGTPNYSHINRAIEKLCLDKATSPIDQYNKVREMIRYYGQDGHKRVEELLSKNPTLLKTIKQMGGYLKLASMETKSLDFKQKEFVAIYESEREKAMRENPQVLNKLYLRGGNKNEQIEHNEDRKRIGYNRENE